MAIKALSAKEMTSLSKQFDMEQLEDQLEAVLHSKDPVGYMQSNINWQIDTEVDSAAGMENFTNLMMADAHHLKSYEAFNPFGGFIKWFKRNKMAKKIKKALCYIAAEIKEKIDAGEKLKALLTLAITAVAAAIGLAAINPVVLTLIVGILATMILKGVDAACAV